METFQHEKGCIWKSKSLVVINLKARKINGINIFGFESSTIDHERNILLLLRWTYIFLVRIFEQGEFGAITVVHNEIFVRSLLFT